MYKKKNISYIEITLYYNFILTRNSKITKLKLKALFPLTENQTDQILTLKHKV